MIPPEKTLANISGKMVIISNLIQFQKAIRGLDADLSFLDVNGYADLPRERNIDFLSSLCDDKNRVLRNFQQFPDDSHALPGPGENRASQELELIIAIFSQRPEFIFKSKHVRSRPTIGLEKRVDTLELEDVRIFMGLKSFDGELGQFPLLSKK
jgi:hypothetical protein